MQYIVFDLEATCWEESRRDDMEVIEIGAVRLAGPQGPSIDEFGYFIRPHFEPKLSDFCTNLTSIEQIDVDSAEIFPQVFPKFISWIGTQAVTLCSWGDFDIKILKKECDRHRLVWPESLDKHINLKKKFGELWKARHCGLRQALKMVQLPFEGKHHRGIDDARNIAHLACIILPKL